MKISDGEIRLAELHPAQQEIRDHPARFKVLSCGRRFGKTALSVDTMVDALLLGHFVAYCAPTNRMLMEVWRESKKVMQPVVRRMTEEYFRMDLWTGGVLECWSLAGMTAETLRGRKYHGIVIDEAALVPDASIWHEALRPLLTDYEGWALFASTPRSRNWFWQLFMQGQDPVFENWMSWTFPTISNPYIKPSEVEDARKTMPELAFRQEYLAEFLEDIGSVFRNIGQVCIGAVEPPREEGAYVFGVDWGRTHDFTVISVIEVRTGRQVYLDRFNQVSWAVQRGRLRSLYERYKPIIVLAEQNSIGDVNIEALQSEGLPVRPFMATMQSKAMIIEHMVLAMEREEVILLRDSVLTAELQGYQMTQLGMGWRYGASVGGFDDCVMATALSWYARNRYTASDIDFVQED